MDSPLVATHSKRKTTPEKMLPAVVLAKIRNELDVNGESMQWFNCAMLYYSHLRSHSKGSECIPTQSWGCMCYQGSLNEQPMERIVPTHGARATKGQLNEHAYSTPTYLVTVLYCSLNAITGLEVLSTVVAPPTRIHHLYIHNG